MAKKGQNKNKKMLIKASGYAAGAVYIITYLVFVWAYLQGVNLFWWATPIIVVYSGCLGLIWGLKKRKRI
jgi:hypothetical protein